jgi:hypothetical protein
MTEPLSHAGAGRFTGHGSAMNAREHIRSTDAWPE